MRKVIKIVDEKRNVIQVTTVDSRWYIKPATEDTTGLPEYKYYPSVTWITEAGYPKSAQFYRWLMDKGWEAEEIKLAAGDKGSKIHLAIADLIRGGTVKMDAKYLNPTTEKEEELTVDEYECVISFANWFAKTKPKVLDSEFVIFNESVGYAGTVDLLCEIDGAKWLVDFKTGQNLWPSHRLQVSAYKAALGQDCKLGLLRLGYKRNKDKYKMDEVDDCFDLFLAAHRIWKAECADVSPKTIELPLQVKLE